MDTQHLRGKIRNLTDRESLLALLNEIKADMLGDATRRLTMRTMMRLCNPRKDTTRRYHRFTIPKKSGGAREIYAPSGNLKWMQLCLNEMFKAVYAPSAHAMGFTQGRSVVDNARMHTGQNYVFNIDLKDFFPSVDQARVWKRLQLAPFNFPQEVANVVAGLCSIRMEEETPEGTIASRYCLPQGAPTSPILTNAICDTLDRRLAGLARRFGLHYSRYADDITFSSMHNVYQEGSEFREELARIITGQNFRINPKKTRLHHRSGRQEVTGLTVSDRVNVTRRYVKDLRAILHIWERYGAKAAFAAFYPRYKAEKGYLHPGEPNMENVVHGKLSYLKMVKGGKDPVYARLAAQYARLTAAAPAAHAEKPKWEYLSTETISDFEQRLGVKITFEMSRKGKPYGHFELRGERILVSVSRNISIDRINASTQISLCAQTEKSALDPALEVRRYLYLVHRTGIIAAEPLVFPELEEVMGSLSKETEDDLSGMEGIYEAIAAEVAERRQCEAAEMKDTLTRLIDSGFDLSIL